MESKKAIKTVVHYFSSDNFEKIFEESQNIKKIYFQDSDENFGRMIDFLGYLKICDKLEINIGETNLTTSQ